MKCATCCLQVVHQVGLAPMVHGLLTQMHMCMLWVTSEGAPKRVHRLACCAPCTNNETMQLCMVHCALSVRYVAISGCL